jgi:hypothetical protein
MQPALPAPPGGREQAPVATLSRRDDRLVANLQQVDRGGAVVWTHERASRRATVSGAGGASR